MDSLQLFHEEYPNNIRKTLQTTMRWKAHLIDGNYAGHANPLLYIFKCPPQHKELIDFENG